MYKPTFMQILGHGIDLANIAQMDRLLRSFGDAAIERQFTEREISGAPTHGLARATYFASCFATKEAVLKALGAGFAGGRCFYRRGSVLCARRCSTCQVIWSGVRRCRPDGHWLVDPEPQLRRRYRRS